MNIIPVVDLMGGVAVHAVAGRRDRYKPLATPLCPDCSPFAVIDAFMTLHDFDTLYVADLDALTHRGGQEDLIHGLCEAYPTLTFWIDRGRATPPARRGSNVVEVVGSESLREETLPALLDCRGTDFLLSLDSHPDRRLGPPVLFEDARYWPEKIILMTLGRVGSNGGPDVERLARYRRHWPEKKFIAAGGVRDVGDLRRLEEMGACAALVATALHYGTLDPVAFAAKRT